jgi:hypothetical protein
MKQQPALRLLPDTHNGVSYTVTPDPSASYLPMP